MYCELVRELQTVNPTVKVQVTGLRADATMRRMHVGVTDDAGPSKKEQRKSTSGARLYVMGTPELVSKGIGDGRSIHVGDGLRCGLLGVDLAGRRSSSLGRWVRPDKRRARDRTQTEYYARGSEDRARGGRDPLQELAIEQHCADQIGGVDGRVGGGQRKDSVGTFLAG